MNNNFVYQKAIVLHLLGKTHGGAPPYDKGEAPWQYLHGLLHTVATGDPAFRMELEYLTDMPPVTVHVSSISKEARAGLLSKVSVGFRKIWSKL